MNRDIRTEVAFWLFMAFLLSWVLSEAIETWQRQGHTQEIENFINAGARFTAEDGYKLCKRVQHLERQHHDEITIEECKLPSNYLPKK